MASPPAAKATHPGARAPALELMARLRAQPRRTARRPSHPAVRPPPLSRQLRSGTVGLTHTRQHSTSVQGGASPPNPATPLEGSSQVRLVLLPLRVGQVAPLQRERSRVTEGGGRRGGTALMASSPDRRPRAWSSLGHGARRAAQRLP